MVTNFFEIFLLSIIQGISEFLPISSAAHLILVSNLYELKNQSLLIDISLHLGSLLAILYYFRNDIFDFNKNKNLFYKIIIGTLPLIIIGYFLYVTNIIYYFRNIKVIAWATLFFGILLYIADKNKFLKKIDADFNMKSVLVIGFFQVLALIPGVSRAGITITAGRILGFDRTDSTKISFYLSIPALLGASAASQSTAATLLSPLEIATAFERYKKWLNAKGKKHNPTFTYWNHVRLLDAAASGKMVKDDVKSYLTGAKLFCNAVDGLSVLEVDREASDVVLAMQAFHQKRIAALSALEGADAQALIKIVQIALTLDINALAKEEDEALESNRKMLAEWAEVKNKMRKARVDLSRKYKMDFPLFNF